MTTQTKPTAITSSHWRNLFVDLGSETDSDGDDGKRKKKKTKKKPQKPQSSSSSSSSSTDNEPGSASIRRCTCRQRMTCKTNLDHPMFLHGLHRLKDLCQKHLSHPKKGAKASNNTILDPWFCFWLELLCFMFSFKRTKGVYNTGHREHCNISWQLITYSQKKGKNKTPIMHF